MEISKNTLGFIAERSTMVQMFAFWQMTEKHREALRNEYAMWFDLHKSYDQVIRQVLWEGLFVISQSERLEEFFEVSFLLVIVLSLCLFLNGVFSSMCNEEFIVLVILRDADSEMLCLILS